MELHVHFLPGRVNSPGFETLSYQLVANAHILRLCLVIAGTLSWGVQHPSCQYGCRVGLASKGAATSREASKVVHLTSEACGPNNAVCRRLACHVQQVERFVRATLILTQPDMTAKNCFV